jgi:enoyl-CoA hydratase/carnithine racemase
MARKATTKRAAAKPAGGKAAAKSEYQFIETQRRKGALEITLNRPEVLNAINEQMAAEIIDAMSAVEMDRRILAVILQGNERSFCAGADLSGFSDRPQDKFDNYRARFHQRKQRQIFPFVGGYTKPVISAVEGFCLGGGFELAMFGDLIVAGEAAQFGLPEARHSLMPGAGGTQNLPRLIGAPLAKELMWTTRRLKADEAHALRIVNHVVEKGSALKKAREIVEEMSANGPLAVMMIKQAVDRGLDMTLPQGFLQEADLSYMLGWSEDRAAGLEAFAKRTRAKFKGQ